MRRIKLTGNLHTRGGEAQQLRRIQQSISSVARAAADRVEIGGVRSTGQHVSRGGTTEQEVIVNFPAAGVPVPVRHFIGHECRNATVASGPPGLTIGVADKPRSTDKVTYVTANMKGRATVKVFGPR